MVMGPRSALLEVKSMNSTVLSMLSIPSSITQLGFRIPRMRYRP